MRQAEHLADMEGRFLKMDVEEFIKTFLSEDGTDDATISRSLFKLHSREAAPAATKSTFRKNS